METANLTREKHTRETPHYPTQGAAIFEYVTCDDVSRADNCRWTDIPDRDVSIFKTTFKKMNTPKASNSGTIRAFLFDI